MESLTCPKCQGDLHAYERNNVTVDQCTECRGIFLDRGELQRLVDTEKVWHEAEQPDRTPEEQIDYFQKVRDRTYEAPPKYLPYGHKRPSDETRHDEMVAALARHAYWDTFM